MKLDHDAYTNGNGKHSYHVETKGKIFVVYASNRTQAASRVRKDGHEVRSVNMVG